MTLVIPDDILRKAGLSERDAIVEFACRLFDADRLDFQSAARLAGLNRVELENALRTRRIAIWRPTEQDLADEAAAIEKHRGA